MRIRKYPRTPHLETSALQPGDDDVRPLRFSELAGRHVVIEELLPAGFLKVWEPIWHIAQELTDDNK